MYDHSSQKEIILFDVYMKTANQKLNIIYYPDPYSVDMIEVWKNPRWLMKSVTFTNIFHTHHTIWE